MIKLIALSLVSCLSQTSNAMLSRMVAQQARLQLRNQALKQQTQIPQRNLSHESKENLKEAGRYIAIVGAVVGTTTILVYPLAIFIIGAGNLSEALWNSIYEKLKEIKSKGFKEIEKLENKRFQEELEKEVEHRLFPNHKIPIEDLEVD